METQHSYTPLKTRCPACRKSLTITYEDSGQRLLCPACGRPTQVPLLPREAFLAPPGTAEVEDSAEAALSSLADQATSEQPAGSDNWAPPELTRAVGAAAPAAASLSGDSLPWETTAPAPRRTARRARLIPLLVIIVLIQAVVIGGILFNRNRAATASPAIRQELLDAKHAADGYLAAGDLTAAHNAYLKLEETASRYQITDPELLALLQDARQSQEQLLQTMMRKIADESTPPAVAAAAKPPSAPQPETQLQLLSPKSPANATAADATPSQSGSNSTPAASAHPDQPPAPTAIASLNPPPPQPRPAVNTQLRQPGVRPAVNRPMVRPIPLPRPLLSDEQIGRSIQAAATYLCDQFNGNVLAGTRPGDSYTVGLDALCVYALLQAGQAIPDERLNVRARPMKDILSALRDLPLADGPETYARGIRATALALFNRPEDRKQLRTDVAWLISSNHHGAYTYAATRNENTWDNSNSQYGLLGVWSGAEVGVEVPANYWQQVAQHWTTTQSPNGEWSYTVGGGRLSMTVAGIASLYVTHDYLEAPSFGASVGRDPFSPPLARGLKWLETGDNVMARLEGYTLYGIERVGLASGFKYFGTHDWYRELAMRIINAQNPDGSWGSGGPGGLNHETLIQTSYCLLFLARGRHPIIMNKLRFDGAWANRPRDVANLARYASQQLERPLNWQVVPLSRDWTDWTDSPILYLASHQPIALTENDYVKLRRFIDAGGMIFTQADGGSPRFNQFVDELAHKVLPNYEWTPLPDDHEIFSVNFPIDNRPKLRCITNGVRILMLHSPVDLAQWWQQRADKSRKPIFEFGVNLFIYAAGKSDLRNRLTSSVITPPQYDSGFKVRIARVQYGGNWNPEPAAFDRFAALFTYQTGYGLGSDIVDLTELDARRWPFAIMTGTAPFTPSPAQVQAVRKYVQDGGTLFIDAAGGSGLFSTSIHGAMLEPAFPGQPTRVLPPDHPLFAGTDDGMDPLPHPLLRPYAEQHLGRTAARIEILRSGQGRILISPLDITEGLLGTNTWGILGYKPQYAQSLLKNAILWTLDGSPEPTPTP